MSENIFSYKTIDNVSPTGKQSIFFTCHKDDFDKYFDMISDDILKIRDCAIYYTKNQEQDLSNEDISVGLKRMSLFVKGDLSKTLELREKVYEAQCRVLGENHRDTLFTLNKINELKEKIKNN